MLNKLIKSSSNQLTIILVATYGGLLWVSAQKPFIPSADFFSLLMWMGVPLVSCLLIYNIFIQINKNTEMTAYKKRISTLDTKTKRALWHVVIGPIILGGALLLTYVSQNIPSLLTQYLPNKQISMNVQVLDISLNRRSGKHRLYLKDITSEREFDFLWKIESHKPINVNDSLLLTTKQNWFGNYIVKITPSKHD